MDIGSFQAEEFGELQRLVDGLYAGRQTVDRLDMVVQARYWMSLTLWRLSTCFPGVCERQRLCDQLNSALAAHGWGGMYGTVE